MQNKKKDRGMIKWQPFASLPEHMENINKMLCSNKIRKKKLSYDKMNEMNEIVEKSIKNSTKLVLILCKNNEIINKVGVCLSFDDVNKMIIIKNEDNKKERIKIIDILDIKEI